GGKPGFCTPARDIAQLLLGRKIALREFETRLRRSDARVVEGDIAEQRDERVAQVRFGGAEIGRRGLEGAALSAEKIELPARIDAGAVDLVVVAPDHTLSGIDEAGIRFRSRGACGGIDRGKKCTRGGAAP